MNYKLSKTLVGALSCVALTVASACISNAEAASRSDIMSISINSTERSGHALYDELAWQFGHDRVAADLVVVRNYPGAFGFQPLERQPNQLSPEKLIEINENPEPEGPGRPGDQATTTDTCGYARIGTTLVGATTNYHWEYRYTRDTNGDGKNDADAKWVLVRTTVDYFPVQELSRCM